MDRPSVKEIQLGDTAEFEVSVRVKTKSGKYQVRRKLLVGKVVGKAKGKIENFYSACAVTKKIKWLSKEDKLRYAATRKTPANSKLYSFRITEGRGCGLYVRVMHSDFGGGISYKLYAPRASQFLYC